MNDQNASRTGPSNERLLGGIQKLQSGLARRISSGQAVLDISCAVKELLDNALDAQSTLIEIKLKDGGTTCIEVSDNGHGVASNDFENLCAKHTTSKLQSIDDLSTVRTLGFRGEALNALCALSGNVEVVTRTASDETASKLFFGSDGVMRRSEPYARSKGTTIYIRDLFQPFPVRRQELVRNSRRELAKIVSVVQSYAILKCDTRFLLVNIASSGSRQVLVQSSGKGGTCNAFSSVLDQAGLKGVQKMVEFHEEISRGEIFVYLQRPTLISAANADFGLANEIKRKKPLPGRLLVSVNSRPVEMPRMGKILAEALRAATGATKEAAMSAIFGVVKLEFPSGSSDVDANVAADKRKILIKGEDSLMDQVLEKATKFFESLRKESVIKSVGENPLKAYQPHLPPVGNQVLQERENISEMRNSKRKFERLLETFTSTSTRVQSNISPSKLRSARKKSLDDKSAQTSILDHTFVRQEPFGAQAQALEATDRPKRPKLGEDRDSYQPIASIVRPERHYLPEGKSQEGVGLVATNGTQTASSNSFRVDENDSAFISPRLDDDQRRADRPGLAIDRITHNLQASFPPNSSQSRSIDSAQADSKSGTDERLISQASTTVTTGVVAETQEEQYQAPNSSASTDASRNKSDNASSYNALRWCPDTMKRGASFRRSVLRSSGCLRKRFVRSSADLPQPPTRQNIYHLSSLRSIETKDAEAAEPEDSPSTDGSDPAAAELERVVSRTDFIQMEVVGQFNLGFIMTTLAGQLFIIDQHAADEITTFERLCKNHKPQKQPLLRPKQLDMSPAETAMLPEYLEALERIGFCIEDGHLCRAPSVTGRVLGVDDVKEVLTRLAAGERNPMPSSIRAALASRACRSSIMIGTALSKREMAKVVTGLGHLDAPWNCPHGRPTMRHVASLKREGNGYSQTQ